MKKSQEKANTWQDKGCMGQTHKLENRKESPKSSQATDLRLTQDFENSTEKLHSKMVVKQLSSAGRAEKGWII